MSVIIDKIPPPERVDTSPPEGAAGVESVEELVYLRSVSEGHVRTHFIQCLITEYPRDHQRVYKSVVKETLEPYLSAEGSDIWFKVVSIFVYF